MLTAASLRAPSSRGGPAALLGRAPSLARSALAAAAPPAPRRYVAQAPTVRCVATAAGDAGPGAGSGGARSAGSEGGSERPVVAPAATQAVAKSLLDALVQQAALLPAPPPAGSLEQLARATVEVAALIAQEQQQVRVVEGAEELTRVPERLADDCRSTDGKARVQEQLEQHKARAVELEALLAVRDAEVAELKGRLRDAAAAGKLSPEEAAEALLTAAKVGDVLRAQALCITGASTEHAEYGLTALHYAALAGHSGVAGALLEAGANPDAASAYHAGATLLHFAAQSGHCAVVEALLKGGADPDTTQPKDQARPLHLAAARGYADVIRALLNGGAWSRAPTVDLERPLHIAAKGGHLEAVRVLLEAGAGKDARAKDGWRPLHYAASKGHAAVIQALVEAGANVEARTEGEDTPLSLAADSNGVEAVKALLAAGAKDGKSVALERARSRGHKEVVELLKR